MSLSITGPQQIDDLGSFDRPPLKELVLGVQFSEPIVDLDVLAAFGLRVRSELPGREQHNPLPRVEESFALKPRPPRVQLKIMPGFVLPRAWFVSADKRQLVQLQSDRLVFNWRRMTGDDRYPRYRTLRPVIERHLATLRGCLAEAGKPAGAIDVVEVTYVNEVSLPDAPRTEHPPLSRALRVISEPPRGGLLPQPEDSTFQARYRIPDPAGGERPAGRLYVSAEPHLRTADLAPIYLLRMTSHIVIPMPDDEAVVRAMNLGRKWARQGFDELTTSEIRSMWHPVAAEGT